MTWHYYAIATLGTLGYLGWGRCWWIGRDSKGVIDQLWELATEKVASGDKVIRSLDALLTKYVSADSNEQ